jgi:hypothetical protein
MPGGRTIETFLARYPAEVRDLALSVRTLLKQTMPGVSERLDASARIIGYSYGPGYKGLVCTIIPSRKGVKLGFFRGSELPDPGGLLQGAGKVHRHVPLQTLRDLERPGLKPLVKTAVVAWKKR